MEAACIMASCVYLISPPHMSNICFRRASANDVPCPSLARSLGSWTSFGVEIRPLLYTVARTRPFFFQSRILVRRIIVRHDVPRSRRWWRVQLRLAFLALTFRHLGDCRSHLCEVVDLSKAWIDAGNHDLTPERIDQSKQSVTMSVHGPPKKVPCPPFDPQRRGCVMSRASMATEEFVNSAAQAPSASNPSQVRLVDDRLYYTILQPISVPTIVSRGVGARIGTTGPGGDDSRAATGNLRPGTLPDENKTGTQSATGAH